MPLIRTVRMSNIARNRTETQLPGAICDALDETDSNDALTTPSPMKSMDLLRITFTQVLLRSVRFTCVNHTKA